MTSELTKAAQQALEVLESLQGGCTDHDDGTVEAITVWCPEVIEALRNALTQRPAAQTEREAFESAALAKWGPLDFERSEAVPEMYYNQRLDDAWIGFGFAVAWLRASLPAHQQATPASGNILTDAFNEVQALKQQATPEPVPAEQAKWCEYVAGMVDCWVSAEWSNYHHMDEDRRIKAIAGIIERRLWALQKQPATPEPVGEPVGTVECYQIRGEDVVLGYLPRPLPVGTKLYTRPAPGVPEVDDLAQFIRQIDGKHSMGAGALAEHICDWLAAAQAKGWE